MPPPRRGPARGVRPRSARQSLVARVDDRPRAPRPLNVPRARRRRAGPFVVRGGPESGLRQKGSHSRRGGPNAPRAEQTDEELRPDHARRHSASRRVARYFDVPD
ncbi:MAG: hypothetical protein V4550_19170 [Gemmatimonadota bacterium]